MSGTPDRTEPQTSRVVPVPSAVFQSPFRPGEIIAGKYRVERLIGTGGVGFVVAATHVALDDGVALKFLKPEYATLHEAVTRFTIEARASFKIKNDHVARVLDVDTLHDGTPFMVMELLDGLDLRSVLEAHRNLPIDLAVDFALQTCEALAAAHACQIVHRDIKPENLFVTQSGEDDHIKVLDFGISKVALTQHLPVRRTRATALTMMAVGTPPYMSPEQVRASDTLDGRSDLWSIGCVLYEMISGLAPFERMSLMQSCAAVLEDEPLPLREACPEVSPELDAVVMRCLHKSPDERYADAAELARALAPFAARRASCADRCAELLAEGRRRSTPGYRRSDPVVHHNQSTAVRVPTRLPTAPPPPPRNTRQFAAVTAAPLPPLQDAEASGEILLDSDLRPQSNRFILAAVGALTLLSVTYLAVRHSDQLARTAGVQILRPGVSAPASAAAAPVPSSSAVEIAAPAVQPQVVEHGVAMPRQPAHAAELKADAAHDGASAKPEVGVPADSRSEPAVAQGFRSRPSVARPRASSRTERSDARPKAVSRPVSTRDEDPDVGF